MRSSALFSTLSLLALACGGGGAAPGGGGDQPDGTFSWTEGSTTFRANNAQYTLGATLDGHSFLMSVNAIAPNGAVCLITGYFAAGVPPAADTYPVAPIFQGTTELPVPDASFTGLCTPGTITEFATDPSLDGEVRLSRSIAGDVRGSFSFEAATGRAADAPTTTFMGEFSVACDPAGQFPCGPLSLTDAGTCADLLACCNRATTDFMGSCLNAHAMVSPNGDAACGRTLLAQKLLFCP